MKRVLVSEEGIGSIINRFENEKEQTVETFNRMFHNCKLKGFDYNLTVTIGDYNKGYRCVTIGDTITLDHEFSLIDLTLSETRLTPFILKYSNGDIIGKFNSYNKAAEFMDMDYGTFRNKLSKSNFIVEELTNE